MTPATSAEHALYGPQFDFVTSNAHYAAMIGGIGSGKSYAGAVRSKLATMGVIGDKKVTTPNLGVVTAATYKMLKDATFRSFREVAGDQIAAVNKSDFVVTMVNGSEILFRSATDPETLRGPSILWWWADEAALYSRDVWPIMIGRLRQFGSQGYAWPTTTPKGRNWLYREFVQEGRGGYQMYRASTRANPFIDESYVQSLESSYTGDFAQQELHGDFVAFEGLVYLEYRHETHVQTPPPVRFPRYVAGVDWGYANPGVILVFGVDGDGRMFLVHEEYQRQQRIEEWAAVAAQLNGIYRIEAFVCDPSEPDFIEQFAARSLTAVQANNSVLPGIQAVKNRLVRQGDGKPRLMLSPDAVNTQAEFEQYQWMEHRDSVRDQPKKANDHAMDSLRYACMYVDGQTGVELVSGYAEYQHGALVGSY